MKKSFYATMLAAGIAFVTGCMSFEDVKKKADAGDGYMAYRTGVRLKKGIGVKPDCKQACVYFGKAAKAGYEPRGLTVMDVEHRNMFGSRWDIAAAWEVVNQADVEQSNLFGDCYKLLWVRFSKYNRKELYERGLNYLKDLQIKGKDAETYALKKRLIAIIRKNPSKTREEKVFLEKLAKIKTKNEILAEEKRLAEQKRITEEKIRALDQNEQKKFPNTKLGKGIRLYKDIYAGTSLEWLKAKAAVSNTQIKKVSSPMFQNDFLPGIPERWQGQTFRQNYAPDEEDAGISYIFAGANNEQIMIGCCIGLRNVSAKGIIEKYKKEFPGLKIQEKRVPQMRFFIMLSPQVRIQVIMMQPGNFVSIFIADQKYVDLYRDMIQKSAQEADQKALDF